MTTITDFLLARITEDEAVARAADARPIVAHGRWSLVDTEQRVDAIGVVWYRHDDGWSGSDSGAWSAGTEHLERFDPTRVLAECEAKRRIIELHSGVEAPDLTDEELHERQAHPEWEYLTVETGRKSNEDDSPPDDTWEPNTRPDFALPDGTVVPGRNWERFEYTEETYYRRRRPGGPAPSAVSPTLLALAQVYVDHPDYDPSWAVSE